MLRPLPIAVLLALTCSCTMEEGGHTVALGVQPTGVPVEGEALPVQGEEASVYVDALRFDVGPLQLLPCESSGAVARAGAVLRGLFALPTAHAHPRDTPTAFGGTMLVNGLDGALQHAALLEPPVDRYCTLRVSLSPTDVHALGFDQAPELWGMSIHASGEAVEGSGRRDFEARMEELLVAELPFETPLALMGPGRHVQLVVELDVPAVVSMLWQRSSEPGTQFEPGLLSELVRVRLR